MKQMIRMILMALLAVVVIGNIDDKSMVMKSS
jgi:hypothetical protein